MKDFLLIPYDLRNVLLQSNCIWKRIRIWRRIKPPPLCRVCLQETRLCSSQTITIVAESLYDLLSKGLEKPVFPKRKLLIQYKCSIPNVVIIKSIETCSWPISNDAHNS
jgi:hypothetical protein